jgi:glycosyltransferase involved in cell wall biosynthesis
MKIAFDLRRIKNPGIGRYMKCLTEAIVAQAQSAGHEYLLILPPDSDEIITSPDEGVKRVISSTACYSLREQIELPRLLRREKIDLLHTPHFNLPLMAPCPTVVTIHDVIYLACKQDLPSPLGRLYYRAMMTAAVRRAERVLTDSEFSKNDLVHYLHADPAKIDVVYPAVPPGFERPIPAARIEAARQRYSINAEYVFYAGIYKLRKNHEGLLRAFRELLNRGARANLVIAGPLDEGEARLRRFAEDQGIGEHVTFVGHIPDADLAALYSGARVYACPSLYEGFGFTVLEAMACGVPVVCSPETSLPEVAGEAALYADPRNPQEFAKALERVFRDEELRAQMIERGHSNRRRFSWEAAATRVLTTYHLAAGLAEEQTVCA